MDKMKEFSAKVGCYLSIVADVLGILLFLLILIIYFFLTIIFKYMVNRVLLTLYLCRYKVPRGLRREILSDFDGKWFKTLTSGINLYKLLNR